MRIPEPLKDRIHINNESAIKVFLIYMNVCYIHFFSVEYIIILDLTVIEIHFLCHPNRSEMAITGGQ